MGVLAIVRLLFSTISIVTLTALSLELDSHVKTNPAFEQNHVRQHATDLSLSAIYVKIENALYALHTPAANLVSALLLHLNTLHLLVVTVKMAILV
jgi:hypothetical protein